MSARPGKTIIETLLTRRQWLTRITAMASATAVPLWMPDAWAHSAATLSGLPRPPLVIGNTRYARAPLRTPVNDAKAIGVELQKLGFQVRLELNAGRAQMVSAMRDFSGDLAKQSAVGFLYYAGHGAQFESRNYLIPVDAAIKNAGDMREEAVDLNSLLQALTAARNPLNAIVLDASRDYPFHQPLRMGPSGLAPLEAP